ncbi:TetR family transcriptional regulator [Nocardia sp. NPDC050435]
MVVESRSARVRQAIVSATIAQVAEHGIEGLSINEVAERAGVGGDHGLPSLGCPHGAGRRGPPPLLEPPLRAG